MRTGKKERKCRVGYSEVISLEDTISRLKINWPLRADTPQLLQTLSHLFFSLFLSVALSCFRSMR